MSTTAHKGLIDREDVERRIQQAQLERAQSMSAFMRRHGRRMMLAVGTMGALYVAVLSYHR